METRKLAAASFGLIGFAFLFQGVLLTFMTMGLTDALASFSQQAALLGQQVPDYSVYITVLWIFVLVQYLAGVVSLAAGVSHMREKPAKKK